MKVFKLKLSEALGFHGLTAKLVEEEMNDKGHNRASEEKLVKVRERDRERGREGERERGIQGDTEVMGKESCTGSPRERRKEREIVESLYSFSFSCIEG